MLLIFLITIQAIAGLYEEVIQSQYYKEGQFDPLLMYYSSYDIRNNTYISMKEFNNIKDMMFIELDKGREYFDKCYVFYNISFSACSTKNILLYLNFTSENLKENMKYNDLLSLIAGARIIEIKETRVDPETNLSYNYYIYKLEKISDFEPVCFFRDLINFFTLNIPALVLSPIADELVNKSHYCILANSYYEKYLIHLSDLVDNHVSYLQRYEIELNNTYLYFENNGGCRFFQSMCKEYNDIIERNKIVYILRKDLVSSRLANHSYLSARATYNKELIEKHIIELNKIINNTLKENEELLDKLSNISLSSYCKKEQLILVDYKFEDGSPYENCEEAYNLLNLISNIDLDTKKLFFLNNNLKQLYQAILKYNKLDLDAYKKTRIAIDMLRRKKLDELSKFKFQNNIKRSIVNEINNDKETLGRTYVFLKNFRFEEYNNKELLYNRIKKLIELAELDEINVNLEKTILEVTENLEDLYMIENNIYQKATTKYSYLYNLRSEIKKILNIAPKYMINKYITELSRIEGGEDLDISKNIGRLKIIDKEYKNLLNKLGSELNEYLRKYVNINIDLTYPNKFFVDKNHRVYILVRICNPFEIELKDIQVKPNIIMKEFGINTLSISKLAPQECYFHEAYKDEIIATSQLIKDKAKLINNTLYTQEKLIIISKIKGVAVFDYNEYEVDEGVNEFKLENSKVVNLNLKSYKSGNNSFLELEWNYGSYKDIEVSYMNLLPCKIEGIKYIFCLNSSELINKSFEFNNKTINISTNHSRNITILEVNNTTLLEARIKDEARAIYNSIKSLFKTNEGKTYLSLTYHRALTGNETALNELREMASRAKNSSLNTSIIEKYINDYSKEYFDLDPSKINQEIQIIKELSIYDPEKANEKYAQLVSKIEAQYEIAKERLGLFIDKYSENDRAKIAEMLNSNKLKEAINYIKNVKPSFQNNIIKTQNNSDLKVYALVFILVLIGLLAYYMIKKNKDKDFKTLEEEKD